MSARFKAGIAATLLAGCAVLVLTWWASRAGQPDFGEAPDFASISDLPQMKSAFFDYLTPIVDYHNDEIEAQRRRLAGVREHVLAGGSVSWWDRDWLERLAAEYEQEWGADGAPELIEELINRVDTVPLELVLVQAAKESGWGRSRFAREANNYFGQWCYRPGCGVVPAQRTTGATHEVERFDSVGESVRRYMNNLNTHPRYQAVRDIRASLRASNVELTGEALAAGLTFYSERREVYVREVRAMIHRFRESESRRKDRA